MKHLLPCLCGFNLTLAFMGLIKGWPAEEVVLSLFVAIFLGWLMWRRK